MTKIKNIQQHVHRIRKRAWKHKIALHHFDRAIPKMEQEYLHTSLRSTRIILAIHEMKMHRIQEFFEY
ncbi:hypothetical protein H5410_006242 [Solanum commersonii]|uniref:Uncharacterized protein n=1 Tax=Solanum commersonii TaxID=4109 RepID=A0A9J6A9C3_SOLCO|nr:hypothetical protein H5410_006242 [Solanum commersonii]